jgi:hypothetical protein
MPVQPVKPVQPVQMPTMGYNPYGSYPGYPTQQIGYQYASQPGKDMSNRAEKLKSYIDQVFNKYDTDKSESLDQK